GRKDPQRAKIALYETGFVGFPANRVDHLGRIGPGLALDRQPLGLLMLEPGVGTQVLHRIDDFGDVAKTNWRAVAPSDDDLAKTRRVENLVIGVERYGLMRAFENALWAIDGRRGQRGANIFEPDAARRQRSRINLDMDGIGFLAENSRFRDAFYRR